MRIQNINDTYAICSYVIYNNVLQQNVSNFSKFFHIWNECNAEKARLVLCVYHLNPWRLLES